MRDAIGAGIPEEVRRRYMGTEERARQALGEPAFDAAWAEGWALPLEAAIAFALAAEPAPS